MRIQSHPIDNRTLSNRAPPRLLAASRFVALIGGVLIWAGAFAGASQPDAVAGDAEFIEFLEYLGSWDGPEEDWVQFLRASEQPSIIEAAEDEVEYAPESASL